MSLFVVPGRIWPVAVLRHFVKVAHTNVDYSCKTTQFRRCVMPHADTSLVPEEITTSVLHLDIVNVVS